MFVLPTPISLKDQTSRRLNASNKNDPDQIPLIELSVVATNKTLQVEGEILLSPSAAVHAASPDYDPIFSSTFKSAIDENGASNASRSFERTRAHSTFPLGEDELAS